MGKEANGKPTVLLSKVPCLRDLCDALGFRNSKEQGAFTDNTHKWRKTYRTSDGRSGTDLIQWKLPKTQDDLTRMADTFLHEVGTGEKFWPHLENPKDRLCFPDDKEKIIDLLKQLFWKQNKYAFNNAKYPKNNESRDPFRYSVNHGREEEREEERNMMRCETEVEGDVSTIQGDDPPAIPRPRRRKSHLYDEPHVSPKTLASNPSSDTTSRNTSSKRPSQSTPGSPLEVLLRRDDRALKRLKISDGKSSESISSGLRSLRRVSDRLSVPRNVSGTLPSANINAYITYPVIERNVPTSRVVPKSQHPTSPPTVMKTTDVEDQTQYKKDALHFSRHQSATQPSSPSPSRSLHPPTPPKPSPPPREKLPSTQLSPPPTKHSITPTAPPAKAPLPIPFYILQHADGIMRQTFWEAGRFGTKSLDEFLGDMAGKLLCRPGDITMVRLVLRLGSLEIDTDVETGRQDVWEVMKGTFKDEIRRAKVRGVGMGAVNVLVQPVMMGKGGRQWGGDGEDDEFEL